MFHSPALAKPFQKLALTGRVFRVTCFRVNRVNIYCVTIIGIIVIFKPATLVIIIKPGSRVEGRGGVQAPGATMRIL